MSELQRERERERERERAVLNRALAKDKNLMCKI